MKNKVIKNIFVKNRAKLMSEFYRSYNPNYWLYKITCLKSLHDKYDLIKDNLIDHIYEFELNNEDYKKMLRMEMHFLYFKIVESLFEIFFAILEKDNRDLWIALTFSNDKRTSLYSDCYNKIAEFTDSHKRSEKLNRILEIGDVKIEILEWVFNFDYLTSLDPNQQKENNRKIESVLNIFAKDFTNRDQYNAYKHSLRIWNQPFNLSVQRDGGKMINIMSSGDAVTYLGKKDLGDNVIGVSRVTKLFDFENDYKKCILAYEFINSMILSRKYRCLDDLNTMDFKVLNLVNFDLQSISSDSEEFSISA